MQRRELRKGEIVQIAPYVPKWGACLLTVTESKSNGARGYVQTSLGQEFLNVKFLDIELTGGVAEWAAIEGYEDLRASGIMQSIHDALDAGRDALLKVLTPAIDIQLSPIIRRKAHSAVDQMAEAIRKAWGLKKK